MRTRQSRARVQRLEGVDFLGGAVFATNENSSSGSVSLGRHINISMLGEINGNFENHVINDPLFMHEYGHTFDSHIFGFLYVPLMLSTSAVSASNAQFDPLTGGTTHDPFWTETRANRHAVWYFNKYYNVRWEIYERPRNPFGFFPRN